MVTEKSVCTGRHSHTKNLLCRMPARNGWSQANYADRQAALLVPEGHAWVMDACDGRARRGSVHRGALWARTTKH